MERTAWPWGGGFPGSYRFQKSRDTLGTSSPRTTSQSSRISNETPNDVMIVILGYKIRVCAVNLYFQIPSCVWKTTWQSRFAPPPGRIYPASCKPVEQHRVPSGLGFDA